MSNCETEHSVVVENKEVLVVELPITNVLIVEVPVSAEIEIEFPAHVVNYYSESDGSLEAIVESYEAGQAVNTNRVVILNSDGRIQHADKDQPLEYGDVLGVTKQSGAIGQLVEVVKFGKLTGASFGSNAENFFLGNNGLMTSVAPSTGIWLSVGMQVSLSEFFVNIGEPIQL